MARRKSIPLARERAVILAVLLGLAVVAWALVIRQAVASGSMSSSMEAPTGLTMGMSIVLFLAIWVAMMVAMMFPAAAPMALMFNAIAAGKRKRGQAYAPTWIFMAGYLVIWMLAGAVAYGVAAGLDRLASQSLWLTAHAGRLGGAVLLAAGLYQLSPLKNVCLAKCRTPTQFIMTSWRNGYNGALRMGIEHGVYCLGCCWLLFVVLFPLGIMNIAAMALLTALIFAEKVLPVGEPVSRIAGLTLIAYGALVIFIPALLPGTIP